MSYATRDIPVCPKHGVALELVEAKAPGSEHTATYAACPRCEFFQVARTPEHEAEIKERQKQ